jgi:predicted RNA-binding Zn-ribbon protein involved in translation (DUF1610 family)
MLRDVSHTELTDEPCPDCGASLDLMVTPPEGTPTVKDGAPDTQATVQLARVFVCPECGWRRVEKP